MPLNLNQSQRFNYTGNVQSITLMPGEYKLEACGANGGKSDHGIAGGKGGYISGTIKFYTKVTLFIVCGEAGGKVAGGYNGGGNGSTKQSDSAAGGGCTHIAMRSGILSSLQNFKSDVLIVGGGGGASGCSNTYGGGGGYPTGTNAQDSNSSYGGPGGPGTQYDGGKAGTNSQKGTFGQGGHTGLTQTWPGGGGGGGWYGGGGGGNMSGGGGAGGGGSSYAAPLTNISYINNYHTGNGYAIITCISLLSVHITCKNCSTDTEYLGLKDTLVSIRADYTKDFNGVLKTFRGYAISGIDVNIIYTSLSDIEFYSPDINYELSLEIIIEAIYDTDVRLNSNYYKNATYGDFFDYEAVQ